jgi:cell division transport system permease protein
MIYFYFKESFNSIRKAKLSFLLSLSITCISVLLISLCVFLIVFSNSIEEKFKERITINVFLDDSLNTGSINTIENNLQDMLAVKSAKFISKDEASKIFIAQTGNDFRNLLDYNPLPSSFEIKLKSEFVSEISISKLEKNLKKIDGVTDVIIQRSLVQKILNSLNTIKTYILFISVFFFLVSVYIVYSTNRLIIHAKISHLETMKLVGAKISAIKLPIIITGIIIGILASSITALVIKILVVILYKNVNSFIIPFIDNISFYTFIFISGFIIGLVGSLIATNAISLRINNNNL